MRMSACWYEHVRPTGLSLPLMCTAAACWRVQAATEKALREDIPEAADEQALQAEVKDLTTPTPIGGGRQSGREAGREAGREEA